MTFLKIPLKNILKYRIEIICPEYISGWIFHSSKELKNIYLQINKKEIYSSAIDILRLDVNESFNLKKDLCTGFKIFLPKENLGLVNQIKIFANSKVNKKNYFLKNFVRNKNHDYIIKLLNSKFLGSVGNIDGFQNDGNIHGWAFNESNSYSHIWLFTKDKKEKYKIACTHHRYLSSYSISGEYGFICDPSFLPSYFSNKEIYFSFDSKGDFNIPQLEKIELQNCGEYSGKIKNQLALVNVSAINGQWKLYIENLPKKKKAVWTKIWIANTLIELALYDDYLMKILHDLKNNPLEGDNSFQTKLNELLHRNFETIWQNRKNLISSLGLTKTRQLIKDSLELITPSFVNTKTNKTIKNIAIFDTGDLKQCTQYRVTQKVLQLEEINYKSTVFSLKQLDLFMDLIQTFDAVIFFRIPAFPQVIKAITKSSEFGIPTFYDIDDLIFDHKFFPPSLDLYSNLISEETHNQLLLDTCLYDHAMQLCDYGIASTNSLKIYMEKKVRSKKVFHHKNSLSQIHLDLIKKRSSFLKSKKSKLQNETLEIFYGTGTLAHKKCFHEILEPALERIIQKYPDKIKINLFGFFDEFEYLDINLENVIVREPIWDYEKYLVELSKSHINLSILEDSEITNCKSEIKWLEAAIFEIPSIVSPTKTYKEIILQNEDGIFAKNENEFFENLELLINEKDLRLKIGHNAFKKAIDLYSMDYQSKNLSYILNYPLEENKALKKKILIVNVYYPPQDWGGATHVVRDNVKELCMNYKDEFNIEILTTNYGGFKDLNYEYTSDILNQIRVWRFTAAMQEKGDLTEYDERNLKPFQEIINIVKPDLVHIHCIQRITTSINEVLIQNKIPYIITSHDGWWISPNQFIINNEGIEEYYDYKEKNSHKRVETLRKYLNKAQAITTVSNSFAKIHENCGIPKVINTENGIDKIHDFKNKSIKNSKVMIAHIGGCEFHKGIDLIKSSFENNTFENIEFCFVDYSKDTGFIEEEKWGSNLVVKYGRFEQKNIYDFLSKINILIVPSRWPESYGLVVREALSCDCWVITSNKGDLPTEIVNGENGFIFDLQDNNSLISILTLINTNYKSYLSKPQKSYSPRLAKKQVEEFVGIYRSILN